MNNGEQNYRLFSPGWIIVLSLAGGFIAGGAGAALLLRQAGLRAQALALAAVSAAAGLAVLIFCAWWGIEWYWVSLAMYSIHLAGGVAIFFYVKSQAGPRLDALPRRALTRSGLQREIAGSIGGLVAVTCVAPCVIAVYILGIDRLFSTLMPVAFTTSDTLGRFFLNGFICALAAMAGGAVFIRIKPQPTVGEAFKVLAAFLWSYVSLSFGLEAAIAIPSFQAAAANGNGFMSVMFPVMAIELLFGSWWSVLLCFYTAAPIRIPTVLVRAGQVCVLNMLTAIIASISLGYPADLFLAAGKSFERHARTRLALACYEQGLNKEPREKTACWMQYRVALLDHKLGHAQRAQDGFRRVVAKYNADDDLVKKADYYLKRLRLYENGKRVVLPGVETRTQYQGTYCVPNSMALVMRFWGKKISAREIGANITGLSRGTYTVDQAWYAHNAGLRHEFLPMASLDDIKRCISAGFPVMVYVPSHIFVIFGYDEALSTFVTYDVATNDIWTEYIQKDFVKSWKRQAATLVLVYPEQEEQRLPVDVRNRTAAMSTQYLHYQIHFFDTLNSLAAAKHLKAAAGATGSFFFPVVTLFRDYQGLRDSVNAAYDPAAIGSAITGFFSQDYDESINLWGQIHYNKWAMPDWALEYGMSYLIAVNAADQVQRLIAAIERKGTVSDGMIALTGMIDLANGRYSQAIDRLQRSRLHGNALYEGLANLHTGDPNAAIRNLSECVTTAYREMADSAIGFYALLDDFGYPAFAMANRILTQSPELGESREGLKDAWEQWSSAAPFDAPTAAALARGYERRLASLAREDDPYVYDLTKEKLALMQGRAARYYRGSFVPAADHGKRPNNR